MFCTNKGSVHHFSRVSQSTLLLYIFHTILRNLLHGVVVTTNCFSKKKPSFASNCFPCLNQISATGLRFPIKPSSTLSCIKHNMPNKIYLDGELKGILILRISPLIANRFLPAFKFSDVHLLDRLQNNSFLQDFRRK